MKSQTIDRALWLWLTAAGLATALSGCSCLSHGCLTMARDNVVPTAVPAMQMAQTLNPEAGNNRKVVSGIDGIAASNVSDAYAGSFERTQAYQDSTEGFQGVQGLSTSGSGGGGQ